MSFLRGKQLDQHGALLAREPNLWLHLRVALTAALVLALCQVVLETVLIAARFQQFIISPQEFSRGQMYDWCVKLFLVLPATAQWLHGGPLDRFLPAGFNAKLIVGAAVVMPNLVVSALSALLVGGLRGIFHRRARMLSVLWTLALLGLVVHLTTYALAVHIPKSWSTSIVVRNCGRVFVYEGTWIALVVLAASTAGAALITQLQPRVRWAVSLGTATAAAVAVLALVPARPAASAVGVTGAPRVAAEPASLPVDNVLLISIDSLRADRLSCYGNPRNTSPTLDELARQGTRFTDVMSTTSWTLPSHMSLLTGRYVLSHGVIAETDQLPRGVPTLAEHLQRAGLATGGIVSTLLLAGHYGFSRGFDYYDDRSSLARTWYEELSSEPAPTVTKLAIKWLQARRGQRFFLFLHFWDVHYDYIPPPPYDTMFDPDYRGSVTGVNFLHNPKVNRRMPRRDLEHIRALYDGEIRWVDDHVRTVLAALRDVGVADRTAVIVTADHGDEFFEHGGKGHQRTLYREVTQVPLILRVPGTTPGQVVNQPVSLVDIVPTVLDLAGVQRPAGLEGMSLMPFLARRRVEHRGAIYAWLCNPRQRTYCEAMQYSAAGTLFHMFQPSRIEWYGPSDDAQHQNLAASSGWPRRRLLGVLSDQLNARWQAYRSLGSRRGTVTIDKATRERLRALGYLD